MEKSLFISRFRECKLLLVWCYFHIIFTYETTLFNTNDSFSGHGWSKLSFTDNCVTKINVWTWNDGRHTMYVLQLHAHMMHDFYCEIFNDAANDASAASHADAFNQT